MARKTRKKRPSTRKRRKTARASTASSAKRVTVTMAQLKKLIAAAKKRKKKKSKRGHGGDVYSGYEIFESDAYGLPEGVIPIEADLPAGVSYEDASRAQELGYAATF